MAAFLSQDVPVNEALSGIFGSISLTAWICLLIPQLLTNYKTKSADGLSMGFLLIWLFGDVTNLAGPRARALRLISKKKTQETDSNSNPAGALVTGIAPTATTLAAYFCFSDLVLISQCLYYNTINARRAAARQRAQSSETAVSEDEPLLRRRSSAGIIPGSQRRPSVRTDESGLGDSLTRIVTGEDETPDSHRWLHNTLSLAAVYLLGTAGWFASYKAGAWDGPEEPESPTTATSIVGIVGMTLGYMSALCYLCARIPQIIKNYREKSCEGLALLFFLLSLTGNLTYGLSVFSYSQDADYVIKALPWLLGSLGTIVEDGVIFYQFRIYDPTRQAKTSDAA